MKENKKEYNDLPSHGKRAGFRRPEKNIAEPVPGAIAGRNAVRELLRGERDVDKIFVQKGEREGSLIQLVGMARERKIPIVEVERHVLDGMCPGVPHQGVVAMAAEYNYATVEEILSYAASLGEPPFLVLCDGIEDPHNLGAVIRSAECLGAHGIIIPKRRAVGLTSTVAKASAGAIEHIKVARVTNLTATIGDLKKQGMWFYAADMDGTDVAATDLGGAIGIVLGNEGEGISRLVREACDFTVSIPMYGKLNSMNVSCAAAVIFAEAARQRHNGKGGKSQ